MAVQVGPTRAGTLPTRAARHLPAAPGWLRRIGIGNLLATMVFTVGAFVLVAEQPTRGGAWAYVMRGARRPPAAWGCAGTRWPRRSPSRS